MRISNAVLLLQSGNFALNLFPHMAVKFKRQLAGWALEKGSFVQGVDGKLIFLSAKGAGNWQLFPAHRILQFLSEVTV